MYLTIVSVTPVIGLLPGLTVGLILTLAVLTIFKFTNNYKVEIYVTAKLLHKLYPYL